MFIVAMLFALLFAFIIGWLALLNQNLVTIVLPPGNYTLNAYVWEIILASAGAALILALILLAAQGSSQRRWEREMEAKVDALHKKLDGLASKVEEMELKEMVSPVGEAPSEGGEG